MHVQPNFFCIIMGVLLNACVDLDTFEDFKVGMMMNKPLKMDKIQMYFLEVVWLTCMQNVAVEKSLIELGDVQQQIE